MYSDTGSGSPIVFLPGLGADHLQFSPQIQDLGRAHRVITIDLPGNGKSGVLTGPVDTVLDRQADDVTDLLKSVSCQNPVLVGTSYGSIVALDLALRDPDEISGLILVDSNPDVRPTNLGEWCMTILFYATQWMYYLPSGWFGPAVAKAYKRWPIAAKYMVDVTKHLRNRDVALQRMAQIKARFLERVGTMRVPTLGLIGGDDPPSAFPYMKRVFDRLPDATMDTIPDAMDPTNLCQPVEFDRRLTAFVSSIGRRPLSSASSRSPSE